VGDVVDWTVNCGVSTYLEFKPLETGVLWDQEGVRRVPCNKSEIFADEKLSVVEKRLLMKFIEFCSKLIQDSNFDFEQSFVSVLEEKRLPKRLQDIILYAVLAVDDEKISLGHALVRMEKYINSLGIYKENCALLYPMYGSSDIAQGFCRMCAVYEGTYVITEDLQISAVEFDSEIYRIETTFGELKGKKFFLNANYAKLDRELSVNDQEFTRRAVILARGLLKQSDEPVLMAIPPLAFGNQKVVYLLQLSESSSTVPAGYSMIHLWGEDVNGEFLNTIIMNSPLEVVLMATYTHYVVECKGKLKHVRNPGGDEVLKHFVSNKQNEAKGLFQECKEGFEFLPQRNMEEEDVLKDI
jgi:Rab proteins geranylgeranyltransferase component A